MTPVRLSIIIAVQHAQANIPEIKRALRLAIHREVERRMLSASNSLFATYVPVNATTLQHIYEARRKVAERCDDSTKGRKSSDTPVRKVGTPSMLRWLLFPFLSPRVVGVGPITWEW